MSNTKPLRIGLVALGGVNGWLFAPVIGKRQDIQLVAGVSPTPGSREKFAGKWSLPVYERFDQMVAEEDLDAVVIGSPTHLHLQHITEAAAAGLHMLVTKPLCNTVAECRESVARTAAAGVVMVVGHEFRYRPPLRRMIELTKQGDAGPIGTPTMLMMHMGHAGGLKQDVPADNWRSDAKNVPGGSGNLLGVHGVDLANALFGTPRRVTGSVRRLCARLPFEDTTAFTIEYDRGTAVITTSYVSQPLEHAYLLGTRGNAVYRDGGLLIEANRQATAVSDLPRESATDCLLDQLVAAVREGKPVESGGESGVASVAVVEAAIEVVKRGCSISLREEVAA